MKKIASLLLMVLLSTALVFAGGSSESADGDGPVDLMFISMGSSTSIYTYSTTIANMLLEVLPAGSTIDVPETSPGGLIAQYSIVNGDTDLVIMNGV